MEKLSAAEAGATNEKTAAAIMINKNNLARIIVNFYYTTFICLLQCKDGIIKQIL